MAPVIMELGKLPNSITGRVCVTAQHRQMLDQVLGLFDIKPDYDLDIMRAGQSPTQVAASVLAGLEPILRKERPDWVLVQGDTTTVAAASLAAFYAGVRVGHVEAGLRTNDKRQPFPEEINRRIAGVIADLHFAPTPRSRANLLAEGVPDVTIEVTGNTVIDALKWVAQRSSVHYALPAGLPDTEDGKTRLILVTAHRRENFGAPLEQICLALRDVATKYGDRIRLVYPVHPNPNVQGPVYALLGDLPNVTLTPPLDYLPMVHILERATIVLTDSGGLQEEAPGFGKPVLVLRSVTERPEGVEAGIVRLVGTDRRRIVEDTTLLLDDPKAYAEMSKAVNPYGDGHAAERIVKTLLGHTSTFLRPDR